MKNIKKKKTDIEIFLDALSKFTERAKILSIIQIFKIHIYCNHVI